MPINNGLIILLLTEMKLYKHGQTEAIAKKKNAEGKVFAGSSLALDSFMRNKFQTHYGWRQFKWHTAIFGQLHTFELLQGGNRLADAHMCA